MKRKVDIHKLERSSIRDEQKRCGMFDGRFRTRSERDKSKYSRKVKHKNRRDWN